MTLSDLVKDPARINTMAPAEIPPLLAHLAAIQTVLTARLISCPNRNGNDSPTTEDRLLTIDEAALRLATSKDWIYRRADKLPFTVRMGRQLRFSSTGIEQYIKQRKGRTV